MSQTVTIFLAGIGGVFMGMALLYIAILILPAITNRFESKEDSK